MPGVRPAPVHPRYEPTGYGYEQILTDDIILLASDFGRYGYRRITALLQHSGWKVNYKRVERIWGREGLKVPGSDPEGRTTSGLMLCPGKVPRR